MNCEIDRVGSAIEDFLKLVLGSLRKTPRLNEALQQHAGVLRRVWPSLPISQSEMHPEPPRASQVAEAIVDLTRCASSSHSLMLIIRHGERIDELTRVVVSALSEAEARDIRTVLHVDPRRTNSQCRLMLRQLSKERCTIMQVSKPCLLYTSDAADE